MRKKPSVPLPLARKTPSQHMKRLVSVVALYVLLLLIIYGLLPCCDVSPIRTPLQAMGKYFPYRSTCPMYYPPDGNVTYKENFKLWPKAIEIIQLIQLVKNTNESHLEFYYYVAN